MAMFGEHFLDEYVEFIMPFHVSDHSGDFSNGNGHCLDSFWCRLSFQQSILQRCTIQLQDMLTK